MTRYVNDIIRLMCASSVLALTLGSMTSGTTPPAGSRISGIVSTAEPSPRAVRGAAVRLSSAALPEGRLEVSDDQGRFAFADLPAGRYTVSVAKPGFVMSHFGSTRPGRGPGIPIAVASGQSVERIDFSLVRGAVIAGRVVDHTGRPQRNAIVSAIDAKAAGRQMDATPIATAKTDDRGDYRLLGLAPGNYVVAIQPGFSFNGADVPAASDFDTALRLSKGGNPPSGWSSQVTRTSYAPVVYPGSTDLSRGEPIHLDAGEERGGVDVRMQLVRTARLNGTVVDPSGHPPAGLELGIVWPGQSLGLAEMGYTGTIPARATLSARDGKFSRDALTPGHYTILARATEGATAPPGSAPTLWATADFDVDGSTLPDVVLKLQRGATMTGRLVFDGHAPAPANAAQIEVRLNPAAGGRALAPAPVRVRTDGTFTIAGIPHGQFSLAASILGAPESPWRLESAVVGGTDAVELPFSVDPPGNFADTVITFTDTPTTVSGRLVDALDRPAPDFVVVAFPVDRQWWNQQSRRMQIGRPSTDGHYTIAGLPPGTYYVGAVADVDPGDLTDISFLDMLAAASTRVTLAARESRLLNLKLGRR